jgi:hypothetical protein
MIAGFLYGIIASAILYIIIESVSKWIKYNKLYMWLESKDIDPETVSDEKFKNYYIMWQLSQLPGVEIVPIEELDKDKAPL